MYGVVPGATGSLTVLKSHIDLLPLNNSSSDVMQLSADKYSDLPLALHTHQDLRLTSYILAIRWMDIPLTIVMGIPLNRKGSG